MTFTVAMVFKPTFFLTNSHVATSLDVGNVTLGGNFTGAFFVIGGPVFLKCRSASLSRPMRQACFHMHARLEFDLALGYTSPASSYESTVKNLSDMILTFACCLYLFCACFATNTVALGPLGRNLESDVALRSTAAFYTYSKTRGLFAGISLEGSALIERKAANRKYVNSSSSLNDR